MLPNGTQLLYQLSDRCKASQRITPVLYCKKSTNTCRRSNLGSDTGRLISSQEDLASKMAPFWSSCLHDAWALHCVKGQTKTTSFSTEHFPNKLQAACSGPPPREPARAGSCDTRSSLLVIARFYMHTSLLPERDAMSTPPRKSYARDTAGWTPEIEPSRKTVGPLAGAGHQPGYSHLPPLV